MKRKGDIIMNRDTSGELLMERQQQGSEKVEDDQGDDEVEGSIITEMKNVYI